MRNHIIPSIYGNKRTYTEPVPLKYGKIARKYAWIYKVIFYRATSAGTSYQQAAVSDPHARRLP